MHLHSFQDTELKLHRYVNDSMGQVVKGLTILWFHRGLKNKRVITQKHKFNMHLHSFQDTELKLCMWNEDSIVHVVEWLSIHGHYGHWGIANKRFITYNPSVSETTGI